MDIQDKIAQLRELKEQALAGGGSERIAKQRKLGKGTARERIETIMDKLPAE